MEEMDPPPFAFDRGIIDYSTDGSAFVFAYFSNLFAYIFFKF